MLSSSNTLINPFMRPNPVPVFGLPGSSCALVGIIGVDIISAELAEAVKMLGAECRIIPVGAALDGLPLTVDLLWAVIGDATEPWVMGLRQRVQEESIPLVVQTSLTQLDRVDVLFGDVADTDMIVDATEAQTALLLARHLKTLGAVVHAPSESADLRDRQIEGLQEEVQRISRMLARLAMEPAERREPPSPFIDDHVSAAARSYHAGPASNYDGPTVSGRDVRQVIRQRRLRDELFDSELFADPAWDMLLDLYAARLDRSRVSVSSLCIAAAVPATTALRWIKTLTETGLFERMADQHDARRIFVQLSDQATTAMHRYFARLGDPQLSV